MNQRLPLFSLCIVCIKDYLCSLFVLYESKTTFSLSLYYMNQRLPLFSLCIIWIKDYLFSLQRENKGSLWFIQYKERTKVVFDSYNTKRENKGNLWWIKDYLFSLFVLYESKTTFVLSLYYMNQRLPLFSLCIVWIKDYLCSLFVREKR
jgi:hypothetical protein